MAHYNDAYYNNEQYNLTADLLSLSDSIPTADATITKSVTSALVETMSEVDTLGRNIGPDIMDMLALTDVRTMSIAFVREDALALADVLTPFVDLLRLETISSTDTLVKEVFPSYFESIFVDQSGFRAEITDKALSDTLRLADWLSIDRYPAVNEWSD